MAELSRIRSVIKIKTMKYIFICALLTLAIGLSHSDELEVYGGYISTSEFMGLNHRNQLLYVMGVVDGIRAAAGYRASGPRYKKVLDCFSKINGNQILALTNKWIENNPEHWNMPLNLTFLSMAHKVCRL